MAKHLSQGRGWRLGWHPEASEFPALVGGDDWALELTAAEFRAFRQAIQQLTTTLAQIGTELMPEETITCETSTPEVWIEIRGLPQEYSLGFALLTGRRGEGTWPPGAVPELLRALQDLPPEAISARSNFG